MPNRMYIDKHCQKSTKGVKAMKSKDRLSMMICTSCKGQQKVPLALVGKANKPVCFQLCSNETPPLPYIGQRNAWFDKKVTMWWILKVFWPFHVKENGDVPAILLFDNCTVQTNLDKSLLPQNLDIEYFPENVTNTHQPADMGIIASLKVGYKLSMLKMLLKIFDVEGGYERAAKIHQHQRPGCKGLQYGGKAHVLDAMNLLDNIWSNDGKYASEDSIRCCWQKADILPPSWMADINNEVGSASLSVKHKKISNEDCDLICNLMKNLTTKVGESGLDVSREGFAMQGSFTEESIIDNIEELQEMVEKWVNIESDESVEEDIIEEAMDELDMKNSTEENAELSDDDPMDEEIDSVMDEFGKEDDPPSISFLEASDHIETLLCFGKSIGASSKDLDLLSKLERSFHQIQLSKTKSQPTITRFFGRPTAVNRAESLSIEDHQEVPGHNRAIVE